MIRTYEGSIVLMIIGLLWIMGIVCTIMYAIGSRLYALVALRETQIRTWVAVESGLLVGLAHMQDEPELYRNKEYVRFPYILYSGNWSIDPRHSQWHLALAVLDGRKYDQICLKGTLSEGEQELLTLVWYLEYINEQWVFTRGERMYRE
jgi:hypothetical protein